jgi:hypothetical protein
LIEHIEGIEVEFVAQCLGVDGKKYKYNTVATEAGNDGLGVANAILKSETTDKLQDRAIASLKIVCPHCDNSFDFPEIFHKKEKNIDLIASNICPGCKVQIPEQYIKNRVTLFLKQLQVMYYRGSYKCIEPECTNHTRALLINQRCNVIGCKGRVRAEVSEEQSNDTLRYLQGLFNVDKYKNELMLRNKANKEAADNIPH